MAARIPATANSTSGAPSPTPSPWTGTALTDAEAQELLDRGNSDLVVVLGSHDAGKSTYLASIFLQICQGTRKPFDSLFVGSRTLYTWRRFCEAAQHWMGGADEEILGHTPRDQSTVARRYLHLAFERRSPQSPVHHLLFADVNGEDLQTWAENPQENAVAHLTFLKRARHFLVVADAARLQKERSHQADVETLLQRAWEFAAERRPVGTVGLVLTKADSLDADSVNASADGRLPAAWPEFQKRCKALSGFVEERRNSEVRMHAHLVAAFPTPLSHGQPWHVLEPLAALLHPTPHADIGGLRWPAPPYLNHFAAVVSLRRNDFE